MFNYELIFLQDGFPMSVCQCVSMSVCQCVKVSMCQCVSFLKCQCAFNNNLAKFSFAWQVASDCSSEGPCSVQVPAISQSNKYQGYKIKVELQSD